MTDFLFRISYNSSSSEINRLISELAYHLVLASLIRYIIMLILRFNLY